MGYDRGRRKGRDKRDNIGEEGYDPFYQGGGDFGGGGGNDRFGGGGGGFGGNDRGGNRGGGGGFGGGERGGGGGFGGGDRGGGAGGGGRGMPAQVVGTGQGKVKFFNAEKGFGFIRPDVGSDDVFVHISAVQRSGLESLTEDQAVAYELKEGRDGRSAAGDLELL